MARKDTQFVRGADKLSARIQSIKAAIALPSLTSEIADLLVRRTLQRFDREEDPDGKKWAPLATETLATKQRLGYGKKGILKRTESLREAIGRIRGGIGTFAVNTGAGFRIGIKDPATVDRARALNYGTNKIPARRFLGIGRLDVKAVDSLMRRRASKLENL